MINSDSTRFCPFCGGYKLKIESKTKAWGIYGNNIYCREYTMSVRCNKCHSRGPTINGIVYERTERNKDVYEINTNTIKEKSKKKVYGSPSELERLAIKEWNNRLFETQ